MFIHYFSDTDYCRQGQHDQCLSFKAIVESSCFTVVSSKYHKMTGTLMQWTLGFASRSLVFETCMECILCVSQDSLWRVRQVCVLREGGVQGGGMAVLVASASGICFSFHYILIDYVIFLSHTFSPKSGTIFLFHFQLTSPKSFMEAFGYVTNFSTVLRGTGPIVERQIFYNCLS